MNAYTHLTTARTHRRVSAAAITRHAATDSHAARLAAIDGGRFETANAPHPLWDDGLLARLTQPLSRIRE
jgi:hypothetical protein